MKRASLVCLVSLLWLSACSSIAPLSSNTAAAYPAPGDPIISTSLSTVTAIQASRPQPHSALLQAITPGQAASSQSVVPLSTPADLWERIRRGFQMPDLQSDLVQDRELWYSSRPDTMYRMTERSRKYLFHIVEELERRNMPSELALLPFIESAFNPQAVSSAKAAGMWQFMPSTGKYFELKQNAFRDDRRDVLASTRAALDYLQKLHGMFGDWHLALAAYNWGEGSVGKAIAKNQKAGLGTTYLDLGMPMETRFYVPKLQAVKNIIARPEAFRSLLPQIENHPYFQSVEINRDIDVALAARLAEVPLEDFKALNPSVNRPVILAAGTPQILLPWDNAKTFLLNLDAYSGQLASWTVWITPTAMKVADAAKRNNMSEAQLRSVNNIPARMSIKGGSSLLVHRSDKIKTDVAVRVADHGQLSLSPEAELRRTVLKAKENESVKTIAKRHHLSAASVALWNQVGESAVFAAGQQVVVFLPAQPKAKTAVKAGTAAKSQPVQGKNPAQTARPG